MDVLKTVFQGSCVLCKVMTGGTWCSSCEQDLFTAAIYRCPVCALPAPDKQICGKCLKSKPGFCRTEVFCHYRYPANKLIKLLKFNNQPELAFAFADCFAKQLARRTRLPKLLIPVPLHPQRQRERGYNQSLVFANRLANQLDLQVCRSLFVRERNTTPQSALLLKKRKKNVVNAFKRVASPGFKHVAIVDDVITSGSTVNELVNLLKKDCDEIEIWAIAKTNY